MKFDVLCIETQKANRPPGFADKITKFLAEKGYVNVTMEQGRNTCTLIIISIYFACNIFHACFIAISILLRCTIDQK
jgi:hypothetical protein